MCVCVCVTTLRPTITIHALVLHELDDDRARSRRTFHSTLIWAWRRKMGPPKNLHGNDVQNRRKRNKKEISEKQEQCAAAAQCWIPHFSFFLLLLTVSDGSICLSVYLSCSSFPTPFDSGKRRQTTNGKRCTQNSITTKSRNSKTEQKKTINEGTHERPNERLLVWSPLAGEQDQGPTILNN